MNDEDWLKEYLVTIKVQTDVGIEEMKSLKFWENQTHSDESPFFLVTDIVKVQERQENDEP